MPGGSLSNACSHAAFGAQDHVRHALSPAFCDLSLTWAPGLKFPLEIGGPALSVRAGYDAKRF
jgi:hypothetical protein